MKVAVIDYGAGNIKSVCGVLKAASSAYGISAEIKSTSSSEYVASCDKVVLPGVGSFSNCYNKLASTPGMINAIKHAVVDRKVEFLGVCVGMQLLATVGLEDDKTTGLNWIPGLVARIGDGLVKTPHMGWNYLNIARRHHLFANIPFENKAYRVYFVHSYEYLPISRSDVLATTCYGTEIVAAVARYNIAGVQFHPEKSHGFGVSLCRNFLTWCSSNSH
ncbi:MAG: imidazole glycerol phosphate synthase subunit HisH [Candidatus Hodgkinia cicadicola]|nr:MAG: imidazole glycerol phosphate synthase subunit HisH [Candidatus Hodgkinia cicadicola]